jgi:hypothetical protein
VTNTGTGEKKELHNCQTKSCQIQETAISGGRPTAGRARFPPPGAGKVPPPFAQGYSTGDTNAFQPGQAAGAPPLREEVARPQRAIKEKESTHSPSTFNI